MNSKGGKITWRPPRNWIPSKPLHSSPPHPRTWTSFSGTTPQCSARPTASRATPATLKMSCRPSSCACCAAHPDAEAVGNMEGYLRRAAVNAALDLIRSRQAAPHVPLDDVAPLLSENASLAPDRLHRSTEIRLWLRQAVARLSPRAAEMFALRFFEGRDNPEIAQALGTTPASVAVTLSRTRDRIRQEFRSSMGEIK